MRIPRFVVLMFLLLVGSARADRFALDMLETEDSRLLFKDPYLTYLTPHVIRTFQNSLEFHEHVFNWAPYEKVAVKLQDYADDGTGSATSTPTNVLWLEVEPPTHIFETNPKIERMYALMNHEVTHLATTDVWNKKDGMWRRFFGGKPPSSGEHPESILYSYLTTPRNASPRWYKEGSAVFMETWMSGGIGRAQGAYDEMVFRAMVRDDALFYSNLGLVSEGSAIDFQTLTNAYLYGARFISYVAYTRSPEQVIEWLSRGEDSKRYYSDQFKHVFGETLEDAWDQWIAFEHDFQKANLASVRQYPTTSGRRITTQALGSISRAFVDEQSNMLYAGFHFPGVVAHIGAISLDDGNVRRLEDIKGPMKYLVTSTAFDPKRKKLFYTADNVEWRDLIELDVNTGESRMLLEDARIGDLAFNRTDDSLWGLRHQDGYVTLVRIPPPYDTWYQVHTWPYGEVMSDLDISPDGTLLSATMENVSGNQWLKLFRLDDLLDGQVEAIAQFDFGRAIPEGFVFSPDGRYLFGSSYYTGVSNIFRYEIASGDIEAVSNAETGFFRPIPLSDGSLIVFEYTGQGFIPTRLDPVPLQDLGTITFLGSDIVKKHPIVRDWAVGSATRFDVDALITNRGVYVPNRELQYVWGYPVVEGYRGGAALGWSLTLEDPLLYNSLRVDVSYSIDGSLDSNERLHADVDYQTRFWHLRYWHNDANFYDLFGPTKRSRKGDAFIAAWDKPLIFDLPRRLDINWEVAYFTGLDTLPGNQNVEAEFTKLLSAKAGLKYSNTKQSLGAVDHEKGYIWDVETYFDHANSTSFAKLRAGLDFGFALPLKHSSIWFYNDVGIADGNRNNSLANWYFGAFGNNYVDDREVKRYREYSSFPGFEIDQIASQNFAKSIVEWNLPPMRFKSMGTPSFYLTDLRSALFTGALVADIGDGQFEEVYTSVGLQIDLEFTVVHRLPMTLSLGYARGFNDGNKIDDEFIFSLKIL